MNLDAERDRLLALAMAAPPGPYSKHGPWISAQESEDHREGNIAQIHGNKYWRPKTTAFLASIHDLVALVQAQAAEIERLRADAERWRFVLEHGMPHQDSFRRDPHFVRQVGSCVYYGATKTEVIDAAIAAERKGAG